MINSHSDKVIIKLDPNDFEDRNNYVATLEDELAQRILDRVYKYDSYKNSHNLKTEEDLYFATKRHDSIHIDGVRGSGKSTVIKYISKYTNNCEVCKTLQNEVKFLSTIDPNQLDKDTNIIDIVTDLIYKTAYEFEKTKENLNRGNIRQLSNIKTKIDDLTFKTSKKDYETTTIKQEVTREERELDFTFHQFAKLACEIFGKKALVLPIDDIDMRLDVGISILETIRKYFQTPHLIPIIALDSSQAYALVKKQFFETFDYKSNTNNSEIDSRSGMAFLKKLPSEYLQKILPPSQRVAIHDMLDYYKDEYDYQEHIKNNNTLEDFRIPNYKPIYFCRKVDGKEILLSFKDMIKLLMNVIFDYVDYNDKYKPDDFHIINYLENKSFRSFLDDARSLIKGLSYKSNFKYENKDVNVYKLDTKYLKIRFQIYSKNAASNKYDGARWFWSKYIENIYTELEKVGKRDSYEKSYHINLDMINDIFVVEPKDTSSLGRKEKIYYRLFIKEFFVKDTIIEFEENGKVKSVIKEYDFQGFLEFIMRILFPASMFELLVNNRFISILKFPLERLEDFASPNSKTTLAELYGEWFPFWTTLYPYSDEDYEDNFLAVKLDRYTKLFRKNILTFTAHSDFKLREQNVYIHPFKALSYISEIDIYSIKNVLDKNEKNYILSLWNSKIYNYMPKGHLNIEGGKLKRLKEQNKKCIKATKIPKCELKDNEVIFGIISSIKYVKDMTNNILFVLLDRPSIIRNEIYSKLKKLKLEINHINILYKIELEKNLASVYSIFLNMFLKIILEQAKDKKTNEEVKFHINQDMILSGISVKNILNPYIADDPYIKNLYLLFKSNFCNLNRIINYIKVYSCILKLNNQYFPIITKDIETLNKMIQLKDTIEKLEKDIDVENLMKEFRKIVEKLGEDIEAEKLMKEFENLIKKLEKDIDVENLMKEFRKIIVNSKYDKDMKNLMKKFEYNNKITYIIKKLENNNNTKEAYYMLFKKYICFIYEYDISSLKTSKSIIKTLNIKLEEKIKEYTKNDEHLYKNIGKILKFYINFNNKAIEEIIDFEKGCV